jgi:hypothetical protein
VRLTRIVCWLGWHNWRNLLWDKECVRCDQRRGWHLVRYGTVTADGLPISPITEKWQSYRITVFDRKLYEAHRGA